MSQIRVQTKVLPGGRIEVVDPSLPVGQTVDLVVTIRSLESDVDPVAFLDSLPDPGHTPEKWAEIEAAFQRERDSWD